MKTKKVWRGLGIVCLCALFQGWPVYGAPFADLGKSSFPEAVRVLARDGFLSGYPDGTFRPTEQVTRAELVATALRLAGDTAAAEADCFEDVNPRAWYAISVCQAQASGFVSGMTETSFAPEAAVTVAQALKILILASNLAAETPGTPWYAPYFHRAETLGLSLPPEPTTPLTRDELSQLLFSLLRTRAMFQDEALPSSGCGNAHPLPEAIPVQEVERTFITSGLDTDDSAPQQLVLAFHGRTSTNLQVRRYYGLEPYANTIFVYPSGLVSMDGFSWSDSEGAPDDALFNAVLDLFARDTCLDLTRVFVVGHSLGASFANSLACTQGDRIRAVGSLGGGISADRCRGKTAAVVFHNPDDRLVPVSEGLQVRDRFLAQNMLEPPASPSEPASFNCERYGSAGTPFPVVWCPHPFDYAYDGTYYPHNWPRGTGRVIMDFFNGL